MIVPHPCGLYPELLTITFLQCIAGESTLTSAPSKPYKQVRACKQETCCQELLSNGHLLPWVIRIGMWDRALSKESGWPWSLTQARSMLKYQTAWNMSMLLWRSINGIESNSWVKGGMLKMISSLLRMGSFIWLFMTNTILKIKSETHSVAEVLIVLILKFKVCIKLMMWMCDTLIYIFS